MKVAQIGSGRALDRTNLRLTSRPSLSGRQTLWKGLERLRKDGKTRAIGVSNYGIKHLEQIKEFSSVPPAVNQIEVSCLENASKKQTMLKPKGILDVFAYVFFLNLCMFIPLSALTLV